MFIVVFDDVDDFVGPFDSYDRAEKWCMENGWEYHSVIKLVSPQGYEKYKESNEQD